MCGQWRNVENIQSEKAIMGRACTPKHVSILLALTIVALRPAPFALAQEPGEAAPVGEVEEPTKNLFTLALGGAIWPSIGNKEFGTTSPTATHPGHVSSAGLAVETAYHRHIAHWERGDLYLGGEFGAAFFNNKGSGDTFQSSTSPITGDLDARVWYAGPSIKFMMGQGRLKYFLGAGGGYYQLDLSESDEISRPPCTNLGPVLKLNIQ